MQQRNNCHFLKLSGGLHREDLWLPKAEGCGFQWPLFQMILSRISGSLWTWFLSDAQPFYCTTPHCPVGPFQSLSWDIFPGSFRKWAHVSTRKTNLVFATVWFVYWSRKEMGFLCKKAFQKDPSSGWANTTATDYKQARRPNPWPRPMCGSPLAYTGLPVFPNLFHTASTHRGFSTPSQRTETSFSHGKPSPHTHGYRLHQETWRWT